MQLTLQNVSPLIGERKLQHSKIEDFISTVTKLFEEIGPLQLGSRDPNSPQNILYYGL